MAARLPAIAGQVSVFGPGADQLTVSGNNNSSVGSVFTVNSGAVATLYGLTIANGSATGNGGGIHNSGTTTLQNCFVMNNAAPSGYGGGIFNGGTLNLLDSTVAEEFRAAWRRPGQPGDIDSNRKHHRLSMGFQVSTAAGFTSTAVLWF